jgi:hypothetical protein
MVYTNKNVHTARFYLYILSSHPTGIRQEKKVDHAFSFFGF